MSRQESNRANARHSTGPRTPQGKAASSQNSTTHGLSVNRISRRNPEAHARWEKRRQQYHAQFPHPETDRLQYDLVDSLATARTRMELIEEAQDALPGETAPEYQTLQRYWRDASRCFSRTLALLTQHRNRPALEQTRRQTQANIARRIHLKARHLEYTALNRELDLLEPRRAAQMASFRQTLQALFVPPISPTLE